MKIPMKWLKEYVPVNYSAEEYASKMIMTGTAVEETFPVSGEISNVVVGKLLSVVPHPDSDHLVICQVEVGGERPLQIVTGAPNVKAGDIVPVALHDSHLPGGVHIKAGKLRGETSEGMLCSGPELEVPEGLYPHCGNEGILQFNEEYAPGTDARDVLGIHDDVIDFEILANRPDLLCVWGIAHESAAVLGEKCTIPEIKVEEKGEEAFPNVATVTVEDSELCPRYCARVIRNVKIGPSPMWMRERLHAAGVRPINNIVDITNYVMLETGHPMHAFDLNKVREHAIVVRRAHEGEMLTTLDGKEYTLNSNMLVIADKEKATGLAGVMGGEESEITEGTGDVLFECAAFDRANIRITGRTLGIRTEASGRFERGVNPDTALQAVNRACQLVNMLGCGEVLPGAYDSRPETPAKPAIVASVSRINSLTGVSITGERMAEILEGLEIHCELDGDKLTCTAPVWRQDLEMEADIAEEVLRMYGYDALPSTLMKGLTTPGGRSEKQLVSDAAKNALVTRGFYEVYAFSFVTPKWVAGLPVAEEDERKNAIAIRNPLGEDTSVMRTSLVPSMLSNIAFNISRGAQELKLFEVCPVFIKQGEGELAHEKTMLSIGMAGAGADFYALRDAVYAVLERFGVKPSIAAGGDAYYHPGRKAVVTVRGNQMIAQLGEIHPDYAEQFDLSARVYVAEIDLEALASMKTAQPKIKALPKFPAVTRDLALVMAEEVGVGPVMDCIRKAAGRELERVELFDIYRGAQLGENKKSVAFSLAFRAADRTMNEEDISKAMKKVLDSVKKNFGAELR
ncbi:MAG: phenylalanine--tRNA ligase subunit beta [Clostridia bacterium]|nr:phenylalanine--tRNA ligase subunit beta [Clostridia bacterium]